MPIWLPLGLKILAKKAIGMNEKLKNSKIFYVARSPPLKWSFLKKTQKIKFFQIKLVSNWSTIHLQLFFTLLRAAKIFFNVLKVFVKNGETKTTKR